MRASEVEKGTSGEGNMWPTNSSTLITDTLDVLVIDRGYSLPVATCLRQVPNVKIHVLSDYPWAPLRFSRLRSSFRLHPEKGGDLTIDAIHKAVKRTGAKIVLPVDEVSVGFVAAHQDALSQFVSTPPVPALDVLDMVLDKWLLANFLTEHKFPCPPTVLFAADEALEHNLGELSFPVLLKPKQGERGGAGIRLFHSADSLQDHLEKHPKHSDRYVVQSLLRGYDMGCNVLCQEGRILAYTIQKARIPARRPYAPSTVLEFVEDEQVLELVTDFVSALGWSGVANIDLRYDEESKEVKILEVNPRYWLTLLGSLFVGVNFPYLSCLAGFGISFPRPAFSKKCFVASTGEVGRGMRETGVALSETSMRYMLADPLPYIVNRVARAGRSLRAAV